MKATVMPTTKLPPEQMEALRMMIGQLPVALAIKNGGEFRIKIADVDATGGHVMTFRIEGDEFVFSTVPAPGHLTGEPS